MAATARAATTSARAGRHTHACGSQCSEGGENARGSEDDRIEADLAQIAQHARPRDSALNILRRLVKARAPCSSGRWHRVKVFRHIELTAISPRADFEFAHRRISLQLTCHHLKILRELAPSN